MKLVSVKINQKDPLVLQYEQAFRRGYNKLNKQQKQLLKESINTPDIKDEDLLKALQKKDNNILNRIKKIWNNLLMN